MKEIKKDRRILRTQNALKTNLLMLMKEQPIQIKTTGLAGGLHCGYKPLLPAFL